MICDGDCVQGLAKRLPSKAAQRVVADDHPGIRRPGPPGCGLRLVRGGSVFKRLTRRARRWRSLSTASRSIASAPATGRYLRNYCPRRQAWFRAFATLCVVLYADAFYTDGQVMALVQCFGATLLSFRGLGALTGVPHEANARAATWEVARAVRDGIGAVVNRAREPRADGRARDDQARRAADEAAAELLRDEERRERRPAPRRRAAAKPEPEPESDSDSSAEQESEPEVVEVDDLREIERLMAVSAAAAKDALAVPDSPFRGAITAAGYEAAGEARMIIVRRIETYPPGRRAQFAAESDEIDADKFGDYARQLRELSPEAFHVTYAAATAAAQQTIAAGVDPDFALVDFFISVMAVAGPKSSNDDAGGETGQGRSGTESIDHRALAEGDQELAAVAIRTMPQWLRERYSETYGITPDTIGEYADRVETMPSEDFELIHRAACRMAQRSCGSSGEGFTRSYGANWQ